MKSTNPPQKVTSAVAPFGLRLRPDLRNRLEEAAARHSQTLTAEISRRLEQSFQQDIDPALSKLIRGFYEEIAELTQRCDLLSEECDHFAARLEAQGIADETTAAARLRRKNELVKRREEAERSAMLNFEIRRVRDAALAKGETPPIPRIGPDYSLSWKPAE